MDVKEVLRNKILGIAWRRLDSIKSDVEQQLQKAASSNKATDPWLRKYDKIKDRMRDQMQMYNLIKKLNFVYDIPDDIEPCLNQEYRCFCDRTTFYWDKQIVKKLTEDQILQIAFCEIFNAYQDYWSSGKVNKNCAYQYRNMSILGMYHIGLLKSSVPYGYGKQDLFEYYNTKYIEPIIAFSPHSNAANYLLRKLIFNDPEGTLGYCKNAYETPDIIEYRYNSKYLWAITMVRGLEWYDHKEFFSHMYFYKLPNGELKKITGHTNIVKIHKNAVNIMNELWRSSHGDL